MSIQQIWEVAGAILVSLGGGGAIVVALSSWLGKVWANRILENEKSAHNKELESYKSQLEVQLSKLEAAQEKALYISKAQYDSEYSIYRELWGTMYECVLATSTLYPSFENTPSNESDLLKYQQNKRSTYILAFNKFLEAIDKYAPFYNQDFYVHFIEIRNLCREIGNLFIMYEFDVKYSDSFSSCRDLKLNSKQYKKVYVEFPEQVKILQDKLRDDIRQHLLNLQLHHK